MDKKHQKILSPSERIKRYQEMELLQLKRTLASNPAQRLAWLEEALEFSYQAGALPLKTRRDRFETKSTDKK